MPTSIGDNSAKGTSRVASSHRRIAKLHMSAARWLMSENGRCSATVHMNKYTIITLTRVPRHMIAWLCHWLTVNNSTHGKTLDQQQHQSRGKWRRENPVLLAWLVWRVITVGKTQHGLRTHQYYMLSEGQHRIVRFVTLTFDPKINRIPGLIVEHLYVQFGDPCCIGFWDIGPTNKQKTLGHQCG